MKAIARVSTQTWLIASLMTTASCGGRIAAISAPAAPTALADLTLTYHESTRQQMPDGGHLLANCSYLGSGDGTATGGLAGTVAWDLCENQSAASLHLPQFSGYIESGGHRHPFQIIGVFTPEPGGKRWNLTGSIVFNDSALLSTQHAPVTGYVEVGVWRHHYTVWSVANHS